MERYLPARVLLMHSTQVSHPPQLPAWPTLTLFGSLYSLQSPGINLDLQIPFSFNGPYTLFGIRVSKLRNVFILPCEGPVFKYKGEHRPYNHRRQMDSRPGKKRAFKPPSPPLLARADRHWLCYRVAWGKLYNRQIITLPRKTKTYAT